MEPTPPQKVRMLTSARDHLRSTGSIEEAICRAGGRCLIRIRG
jgi:hypothetical protein